MQHVIGGELVDGHGTEADPVLNPASEEVLAEIPSATVEDVRAAVDAARAAGPAWGSSTPAVRAAALLKLADLLDERADEFARIEATNVGKPLPAAAEEIPLCSDLRFFAGAARVLEGRAAGEYVEGYTSMIRREPVGVIGQITPWNYPATRWARRSSPTRQCGWCRSRLGAHRQGDRGRGVAEPGPGAPRAGRQGAGGRARRRRRRHGGGVHEGGGLLQRRPGLHRGDAGHRHAARL
jgi:hypothetical protein